MNATSVDASSNRLERLCTFASGLRFSEQSEEIRSVTRACLLYGLAVGVATLHSRTAGIAAAALDWDANTADGPSTRLIDGRRLAPGAAALANAVLLSGRAQGDSHPTGHIGGVVIPVALAMAERLSLSGEEIGASLIAGYEVAMRLGRDHVADLSSRGFRSSPCYGVLGASVAAARAFELDGNRLRHALALATNFAGGLREYVNEGTPEAPFQAGFAARNGLTAAAIVHAGLDRATSAAFTGKAGFYQAFGRSDKIYDERLCEALGESFEFTTATYKPYPACQFLRGMITGLGRLSREANGVPAEHIEIRLCPFEANFIGVRLAGPFVATAQTLMSAPFCAAVAWTEGTLGLKDLSRFEDPAILALIPRIAIVEDASRREYEPRLEVRLADGRVLTHDDRAGGASFAVRWEPAVAMTHQLFDEVGADPGAAEQLIAACGDLERLADVGPIVAAVRRAITSAPAAA